MEKLGVVVNPDNTKVSEETVIVTECPHCGAALSQGVNVSKCPNCGTKPFEDEEPTK